MRQMARKLERAEQKHEQESAELEAMREQMAKLRANCPHEKIEMRDDGVVICKDCHHEVAYAPSDEAPSVDHGGYGNE
jgi:hypothetical protein